MAMGDGDAVLGGLVYFTVTDASTGLGSGMWSEQGWFTLGFSARQHLASLASPVHPSESSQGGSRGKGIQRNPHGRYL